MVRFPSMPIPTAPTPTLPGVDPTREETRKYMAYGALFSFLGLLTVIVVVGWMWLQLAIDDVLKILTTTAGVLSGVVGAVVGFYFRGERE
jgi:hypothetical protein